MSTPPSIGAPPNPTGQGKVDPGTGMNITPANANSKILKVLTGKFGLELKTTPLSERSVATTSASSQTAQGSNTSASDQAEASGESGQTGETQEFSNLVKELNEGKYKPGLLSRFFIKLKAAFQGKDYKTELATQSFKKIKNKTEFLKAAFAFINSSENANNRNENLQTLLLLCTRYCSSLSKSEVDIDNVSSIKKTIEDIQNILNKNISDSDIPGGAYDELQAAAEAALGKLNGNQKVWNELSDFACDLYDNGPNLADLDIKEETELPLKFNEEEKQKAKDDFQALVNELNEIASKLLNSDEECNPILFEWKLKTFLGSLISTFFNTKEGIAFAQQCYEKMPNRIKFLEMAFDQLGLKESAKTFPQGGNSAKDARNLLRLCEKHITDDEWYNSSREGIRSRFSSIDEKLPDEVDKVFNRISSEHGYWE